VTEATPSFLKALCFHLIVKTHHFCGPSRDNIVEYVYTCMYIYVYTYKDWRIGLERYIFVRRRARSDLSRKANRKVGRHVRSNFVNTLFANME